MKSKNTKRRIKPSRTTSSESTLDKTLKMALFGLLISSTIGIALILIGTALSLAMGDPTAFIDPIGYVSLFMSAFFGGFACSKLNRRAPYLTSMLCGGAFVILSMLMSFFLPHSLSSGNSIWTRLGLHTLSLLTFPLGSLVGMKSTDSHAKVKRKKRRK